MVEINAQNVIDEFKRISVENMRSDSHNILSPPDIVSSSFFNVWDCEKCFGLSYIEVQKMLFEKETGIEPSVIQAYLGCHKSVYLTIEQAESLTERVNGYVSLDENSKTIVEKGLS